MNNTSAFRHISDLDLLAQFRQNKKSAFDCFYKKYWHKLLNFSMKYLDDLAACEDIVQELMVKFYIERHFLKIKTSLSSYLYAALKNRILNYLRKQSTYKKHLIIYYNYSGNSVNNADRKLSLQILKKQ